MKRAGRAVELRPAPRARNAARPQECQHSAAKGGTRDRARPAGAPSCGAGAVPASGIVTRMGGARVAGEDASIADGATSGAKRLEPGPRGRRTSKLGRQGVRFISGHIRFHDHRRLALSRDETATQHRRGMKQVGKRKNCGNGTSGPQVPGLRQLDADLIRFVEALAIADARRDHLAEAHAPSARDHTAKNSRSQTGASTNDPRSHLRPILD